MPARGVTTARARAAEPGRRAGRRRRRAEPAAGADRGAGRAHFYRCSSGAQPAPRPGADRLRAECARTMVAPARLTAMRPRASPAHGPAATSRHSWMAKERTPNPKGGALRARKEPHSTERGLQRALGAPMRGGWFRPVPSCRARRIGASSTFAGGSGGVREKNPWAARGGSRPAWRRSRPGARTVRWRTRLRSMARPRRWARAPPRSMRSWTTPVRRG
jgi:hypothetical protein